MPDEGSRGPGKGSKFHGAGTPPHPEPPKAPMEHAVPLVPDQIELMSQLTARLETSQKRTAELVSDFEKAAKGGQDELVGLLGALGANQVYIVETQNTILQLMITMARTPITNRVQGAMVEMLEKRYPQIAGSRFARARTEEDEKKDAVEVEVEVVGDGLSGNGEVGKENSGMEVETEVQSPLAPAGSRQ